MSRLFNAAPGLSSLDLYINDAPRITNIEYKELTNYVPTRTGTRNAKIYESKTNKILLELEGFEIPGGQILTYGLYGSIDNLQYAPIVDDINETIMPDKTKVRFYNLDSTNITYTLTSPNNSSSTALVSGKGTSYFAINPGDYRLEVRSTNPISINIQFNPGRIYTVYIIGSMDPSSPGYAQANIPQVILVVDGNTIFDKCMWF